MKVIARIYTDFKEKFGIPRQSGLAGSTLAKIVFEKEYRNPAALRGLEEYSHLWLIWEFSLLKGTAWSPTVRPPRLGGNRRVGVFATRSPNRPNNIGLSSVKLDRLCVEEGLGTVIYVRGADILDGTAIYDIKPYISYTDSHPDAVCGFADEMFGKKLKVFIPDTERVKLTEEQLDTLTAVLEEDPRPSYHEDERDYGMAFAEFDVHFKVTGDLLAVTDIKFQNKKSEGSP